ncbi:MAG TPA: TSUP family transporter, partial [Methylobacter sp.]
MQDGISFGRSSLMDYLMLGVAALLAGMIDAVVGGGGLIQIPALFSVLPNAHPATLFGTNKLAAVWGTGVAAFSYARKVRVEWNTAAPAAFASFALAFAGAYTVTKIPPDFLRKLLPFVLTAVALYTFRRKDLGSVHAPLHGGLKERAIAVMVGGSIGFYDGFFGPGTGSFLLFL